MFSKQRFPFILLGLGIGIILTNTFYTFNPNIEYREYTEEEIVAIATDLGMVFLKDNIGTSPKEEKEPVKETSLELESEKEKEGKMDEVVFTIETGDSLIKVSRGLEKAGVIYDAEDFLKFAKDRGVDRKLRVGVYNLTTGLDYDTILSILMKLDE